MMASKCQARRFAELECQLGCQLLQPQSASQQKAFPEIPLENNRHERLFHEDPGPMGHKSASEWIENWFPIDSRYFWYQPS